MTHRASNIHKNVLFLPGAAGDKEFWSPVGDGLPRAWHKTYVSWPGLGDQPPDPAIRSLSDLYKKAEAALQAPSVVVAQSMGGIIAVQLALAHPDRVTQLVLAATSGGLDMIPLGAQDWRPGFVAAYPQTARWILADTPDLSECFTQLQVPTLLLWGEKDLISPPAVGQHLAQQIRHAQLVILPGGGHACAAEQAAVVASLIVVHGNSIAR